MASSGSHKLRYRQMLQRKLYEIEEQEEMVLKQLDELKEDIKLRTREAFSLGDSFLNLKESSKKFMKKYQEANLAAETCLNSLIHITESLPSLTASASDSTESDSEDDSKTESKVGNTSQISESEIQTASSSLPEQDGHSQPSSQHINLENESQNHGLNSKVKALCDCVLSSNTEPLLDSNRAITTGKRKSNNSSGLDDGRAEDMMVHTARVQGVEHLQEKTEQFFHSLESVGKEEIRLPGSNQTTSDNLFPSQNEAQYSERCDKSGVNQATKIDRERYEKETAGVNKSDHAEHPRHFSFSTTQRHESSLPNQGPPRQQQALHSNQRPTQKQQAQYQKQGPIQQQQAPHPNQGPTQQHQAQFQKPEPPQQHQAQFQKQEPPQQKQVTHPNQGPTKQQHAPHPNQGPTQQHQAQELPQQKQALHPKQGPTEQHQAHHQRQGQSKEYNSPHPNQVPPHQQQNQPHQQQHQASLQNRSYPPPPLQPLSPSPHSVPMSPLIPVIIPLEQFPAGTQQYVVVSEVVDPSSFWIQKNSSPLEQFAMEINQFYNSSNVHVPKLVSGVYVAARYSQDRSWYRAVVHDVFFPDMKKCTLDKILVDVTYIDYGNREKLPASELRILAPIFLSLPAQAIFCSLAQIKPAGKTNQWTPEQNAYFKSVIFKVQHQDQQQYFKAVSVNLPFVELWFREEVVVEAGVKRIHKVSVAELLINKGIARKSAGPSSRPSSSGLPSPIPSLPQEDACPIPHERESMPSAGKNSNHRRSSFPSSAGNVRDAAQGKHSLESLQTPRTVSVHPPFLPTTNNSTHQHITIQSPSDATIDVSQDNPTGGSFQTAMKISVKSPNPLSQELQHTHVSKSCTPAATNGAPSSKDRSVRDVFDPCSLELIDDQKLHSDSNIRENFCNRVEPQQSSRQKVQTGTGKEVNLDCLRDSCNERETTNPTEDSCSEINANNSNLKVAIPKLVYKEESLPSSDVDYPPPSGQSQRKNKKKKKKKANKETEQGEGRNVNRSPGVSTTENFQLKTEAAETTSVAKQDTVKLPMQERVPSVDGKFWMAMSHIVNPNEFYVHLINEEAVKIDDMQDKLQEFYDNLVKEKKNGVSKGKNEKQSVHYTVGDVCAAKFKEDGKWYRAQVLSCAEADESQAVYKLFFVDFGNSECVGVDEIFPLDPFFAELPQQIRKCSLAYLNPPLERYADLMHTGWPDESISAFTKLAGFERKLEAFIVKEPKNESDPLEIELAYVDDCVDIYINLELVNMDLASSTVLKKAEDCDDLKLASESGKQETKVKEVVTPDTGLPASPTPSPTDEEMIDTMAIHYYSQLNSYEIDTEDPGVATMGIKSTIQDKICHYFISGKGCYRGDTCPFEHPETVSNPDSLPESTTRVRKPKPLKKCRHHAIHHWLGLPCPFRTVFNEKKVPDKSYIDTTQTFCLNNQISVDMDTIVVVEVTAIFTPLHFWVQLPFGPCALDKLQLDCMNSNFKPWEEGETLQSLTDSMTEICKLPTNFRQDLTLPALGEIICSKFSKDGRWYRSRVIDYDDKKDEVEVFHVDYGTSERVSRSNTRAALPQFLHLPFQAVECELDGVEALDNQTEEQKFQARKYFEELTVGASLVAYVQFVSPSNVLTVDLYNTMHGEDDICINKALIDSGLFRSSSRID